MMGANAKFFLFLCALIYTVAVIQLLIKGKINEKNTLHWLSGVFVVVFLAASPGTVDKVAYLVGIDYPPSLLFLTSSLILLYVALRQAVQLSSLDDKVREMAQLIALQNNNKEIGSDTDGKSN